MKRLVLVVTFALVLGLTLIVPLSATGTEGRPDEVRPPAAPPTTVSGGGAETGWDGDGPANRDIVHLDDVIVDGSLCVGFDCVNGESFGFDTLRLKENNLRVHFDDTSNSASFPRNDWRITINDSSNGGRSYFGIDDATAGRRVFEVQAGAPSNALVVDSGGDLGLGTNNPVVDLHIVTGNTPTLRLDQNGSSGFTPQVWDVAGNEANFFIRDVTNGSKLPIRIRPGAPSSSIDIAASGNVGLGTSSPASPLHVKRATDSELKLLLENNAAQWSFTVSESATGGAFRISKQGTGGPEFEILADGTVRMGAGGSNVFTVDPAGNVTITGNLTVGSCTGC